tara:strand:- start:84 stop:359 length:276 start_codon:yes stop_codon:yes gene_type:complete
MKSYLQIGNGEPVIFEKTYDGSEASGTTTGTENKQMQLRAKRNNLLALSDSKVLPDRGLSESVVTSWKTYRQSLRDLDVSDVDDITWPTKP